jgi:hypothetical protein
VRGGSRRPFSTQLWPHAARPPVTPGPSRPRPSPAPPTNSLPRALARAAAAPLAAAAAALAGLLPAGAAAALGDLAPYDAALWEAGMAYDPDFINPDLIDGSPELVEIMVVVVGTYAGLMVLYLWLAAWIEEVRRPQRRAPCSAGVRGGRAARAMRGRGGREGLVSNAAAAI